MTFENLIRRHFSRAFSWAIQSHRAASGSRDSYTWSLGTREPYGLVHFFQKVEPDMGVLGCKVFRSSAPWPLSSAQPYGAPRHFWLLWEFWGKKWVTWNCLPRWIFFLSKFFLSIKKLKNFRNLENRRKVARNAKNDFQAHSGQFCALFSMQVSKVWNSFFAHNFWLRSQKWLPKVS